VGSTVGAADGLVAAVGHGSPLGVITLISWLLTASAGGYMFVTLAARGAAGGPRRQPRSR
jgi:hypothetical protein